MDQYFRGYRFNRESSRFENMAEALGRWYEVYAFPIDAPQLHRVAVIFITLRHENREEEIKDMQLRSINGKSINFIPTPKRLRHVFKTR